MENGASPDIRRHSSINGASSQGSAGSPSPLDYEQMRGKVVLEIYATEHSYQQLLAEFIDVFLRELESGDNEQARAFMSRPNLAGLCSNIEQISHLSQQLRGELHKALDDAGALDETIPQAVAARRAARTAIGPIFKRFASLLQLYEQYLENHAFAKGDIQEFLKKPAFLLFWRKCADDARSARYEALQQQFEEAASAGVPLSVVGSRLKKQTSADSQSSVNSGTSAAAAALPFTPALSTSLDGYLILPVQRVPRYVLLLETLHKFTEKIGRQEFASSSGSTPPGSPSDSPKTQSRLLHNRVAGGVGLARFYQDEVAEIQGAYKLVSVAANRVNEAIRESESSQQLQKLQSHFVGGSVDLVGTGGKSTRRLVREGELMRVTQKSHRHKAFMFHLLSDMILYSESLNGEVFKLHRVIPLDGTCKVFSNIPTPVGAQYDSYPAEKAARNAGTPHSTGSKRPSLRLVRRSSKTPSSPPDQPPPPDDSPPDHTSSRRYSVTSETTNGGAPLHPQNRAFTVATHMKTITMYAATMEEKEAWVKDIKMVIKELAKSQNPHAPPANATLFSAEENSVECRICGTHFSILKRKHHCKRCGVLTCADCCNRKRIFNKATPQRCCDICRLEMDLTARDDQPFRFRIFCQIQSITGLGLLAKGDDRKDPLSRCYFALTQRSTKQGPGMRRGPTSVGHEASFMFPVGPCPEDGDDSPYWVLRVYLLSLGEIGTVTFDVRDLMCAREMVFRRKMVVSYPLKGPLVEEKGGETPPTILLSFELMMPPALWITPDMEADIEKELNVNKRLSQFVHQSSDLNGNANGAGESSPSSVTRMMRAADSSGSRSPSVRNHSASTYSRSGTTADEEERRRDSESTGRRGLTSDDDEDDGRVDGEDDEDDAFKFTVEARLRRFEGEDDEEDEDNGGDSDANHTQKMTRTSTGGLDFGNMQREPSADSIDGVIARTPSTRRLRRPRGRLNVAVYAMYERIAKERPSFWTVVCVKYLYIDTALRLANDESEMKRVSRDALASLQERYLKFDNNPTIRKVWEEVEDEGAGTAADGDPSTRGSRHSAGKRSSSHGLVSPAATGNGPKRDSVRTSMNAETAVGASGSGSSFKNNTPFISQRALLYFEQRVSPPSSRVETNNKPFELGLASPASKRALSSLALPSPANKRSPSSLGLTSSGGSKRSPSSLSGHGSQLFAFQDGAGGVDMLNHPRCLVLHDLLRTERAYVAALELLDEVFITPMMQVAHGASAKSVKQGIEASRGTGANASGSALPQVTANNSGGGMLGSFRQRKDAQESRAVANAIKQPDVTVLLQSVRQILTINKQLLRDLSARLTTIDYSKCIGDIFCRFAVVLKVYNSYATNHPAVERILTPRDVPFFARRPSSASSSLAGGAEKPANSPSSPGAQKDKRSPGASPGGAGATGERGGAGGDDDGEGPSESLINFLKVLEEDERCDGRRFVQLLRLPKERLNRYKRILTSLLMQTPDDHDDAELLRSSLKLLEQSEKHISWSLRRRVNLEKLQDIQKSFIKVLPFAKTAPPLVSARRWFKKEGYLVKRCRRDDRLFRFWLFNDALVYGERVSKTSNVFRFCRFLMLKDMTVHDRPNGVDKRVAEGNQLLGDQRFAFEIRSPEKSFVVMIPLIVYEKASQMNDLLTKSSTGASGSNLNGSAATSPASAGTSNAVNELASDEMKKKLKDDWLREILQCIHDINEDEEATSSINGGTGGETTDSLFRKTASHHRKIDEKAAPVWVHDDSSNTCSLCPNKFTLTFRRHHCRSCGALVCDPCSKDRVVLENIHPVKKQRVCKRCVEEMKKDEEEGEVS